MCSAFYRVGDFLLGFLAGSVIGILLFSAVIFFITARSWLIVIVMMICGVGCGFLAWILNLTGVMIGTSLIGSFLLVRACSWYIGGYPNEWNLYEQLKNKEIVSYWKNYWKFYIYLVVIAILTFVGAFVQYKTKRNDEDEKTLEDKLRYFHIGEPKGVE